MAGNVEEYISTSLAGLLARHTVDVFSPEMLGLEMMGYGNASLSGLSSVTPGANGIIHHPLILSSPFVINQFFWLNGTTINGNTDIGVYSESGTLLVHAGATANSGSNAIQLVDITDFTLPAGVRLWLSMGTDSASHQYNRMTLTAPAADFLAIKGMSGGISGSNLVSSATFANGSSTCYLVGMTGASIL